MLHPQVCEVYRLHRESFYLAVDLYDRFLDSQYSIPKESLQKIGITCLFAAAKIEVCTKHSSCVVRRDVMCDLVHSYPFQEIYPPKVKEFGYVTDGACSVEDILCQELIIYKVGHCVQLPLTLLPQHLSVCLYPPRPWIGV